MSSPSAWETGRRLVLVLRISEVKIADMGKSQDGVDCVLFVVC
jgi:hypothetical protein